MHTHMGRPYAYMGHNIVPYAYGISHTRMGRPIRVWDNIRIWGRTCLIMHIKTSKRVCYNWANDRQPTIHYKASLHNYGMLN